MRGAVRFTGLASVNSCSTLQGGGQLIRLLIPLSV